MARIAVTALSEVNFAPASERDEVVQNVRTILATRVGTVPLDRDFGLSWEHLDKPLPVARSLMRAEVIEAIARYEPRANIEAVEFEETASEAMEGIGRPRVILNLGEDNE